MKRGVALGTAKLPAWMNQQLEALEVKLT
jgi:hypothetical protein